MYRFIFQPHDIHPVPIRADIPAWALSFPRRESARNRTQAREPSAREACVATHRRVPTATRRPRKTREQHFSYPIIATTLNPKYRKCLYSTCTCTNNCSGSVQAFHDVLPVPDASQTTRPERLRSLWQLWQLHEEVKTLIFMTGTFYGTDRKDHLLLRNDNSLELEKSCTCTCKWLQLSLKRAFIDLERMGTVTCIVYGWILCMDPVHHITCMLHEYT